MATAFEESKANLVRRWGEMGGYWGISRTMAEIHALLFVSGRPLCTDDIMEQLQVSRGNASMNLRSLVDWALIERVHKLGDRKEYFQADTDVWHMFETITRERRRRERAGQEDVEQPDAGGEKLLAQHGHGQPKHGRAHAALEPARARRRGIHVRGGRVWCVGIRQGAYAAPRGPGSECARL